MLRLLRELQVPKIEQERLVSSRFARVSDLITVVFFWVHADYFWTHFWWFTRFFTL